jgi:hypothetical protein
LPVDVSHNQKIMEESNVTNSEKNEKGFVSLPFNEDQFKEFVVGLLGRTQSISRGIRGSFDLSLKDVENFYYLINQRILQQNEAKLIQFNTKIVYSDNSSIMLSSFEELLTYNEIRAISTDSIHLSWQYLVKFQDKDIPEKQEIDVSFIASEFHPNSIENDDLPFVFHSSPGGFIPIRIKHTARTWGADIESLITKQIENLLKPKNKIKEFTRKNRSKISIGTAITFFLSTVFGCYFATISFAAGLKSKIFTDLESVTSDSQKIDYLIDFSSNGNWSQHYFYVFLFLIFAIAVSVVLGAWIDDSASTYEPSYINFTKEDGRKKISLEKRKKRKWRGFVISLIMSVVAGILANFLFYYLKG